MSGAEVGPEGDNQPAPVTAPVTAQQPPRVTPADVDAAILTWQFYRFPGTTLTVCCLVMRNDFTVTGESACADPALFDKALGEQYALEDAKRNVWPLLGYALRDKLWRSDMTGRYGNQFTG